MSVLEVSRSKVKVKPMLIVKETLCCSPNTLARIQRINAVWKHTGRVHFKDSPVSLAANGYGTLWHARPSFQEFSLCFLFADFIPHRTALQQTAWFHRHLSRHSLLLPLSPHIRYVGIACASYIPDSVLVICMLTNLRYKQKKRWCKLHTSIVAFCNL